jgi:hypothetical protein
MQARVYQERFAEAAEIAKQAMNGSAPNGAGDGARQETAAVSA